MEGNQEVVTQIVVVPSLDWRSEGLQGGAMESTAMGNKGRIKYDKQTSLQLAKKY